MNVVAVWGQFRSGLETRNSFFYIAPLQQQLPQFIISIRVLRILIDHLAQQRERLSLLLPLDQRIGQVILAGYIRRVEFKRRTQFLFRFSALALMDQHYSGQKMWTRLTGVD